jgi:hypothetical protein
MRVALCYWGLARSTDLTIESIEKYILEPLKEANIDYTVFLHTFLYFNEYNNSRADEHHIEIKNDIWKLLLPNYYMVENQHDIDTQLNFYKYRSKGDPWKFEGTPYIKFNTLDNHIRSLYSLYKVTSLWKNNADAFDVVIYLRPDVRYTKPISIEWLTRATVEKHVIQIPNFHLYDGWNDRFAIGCPEAMIHYGDRYIYALDYSRIHPLHSEGFLSRHMARFNKFPEYIHFPFRRIRADGVVCPNDETL